MTLKTTICALAMSLAVVGCTIKEDTGAVKKEVVQFPKDSHSIFSEFKFQFKDEKLLTFSFINNAGSYSCFYTPGNSLYCGALPEHKMTEEMSLFSQKVYEEGEKQ